MNKSSWRLIYVLLFGICIAFPVNRIFANALFLKSFSDHGHETGKHSVDAENTPENNELAMPQKLVPLHHSVYNLLSFYETAGLIEYLPLARPYTKRQIVNFLHAVLQENNLNTQERKVIENALSDLYRPVNALKIKEENIKKNQVVLGTELAINGQFGVGENATYTTSNIAEPFVMGELGENIGFYGGMGLSVERLAPDLFFQSFVKDGAFHSPHQSIGYAHHPYQYNYETMWAHVNSSGKSGESSPFQDDVTAGMIYHTELSGSWFNDRLRVSIHNQRRAWGFSNENLSLSSTARRFPGVDFYLEPTGWLKYSFLTGSLFSYANQRSSYRKDIYGYDLGHVQKMFTLHMLELNVSQNFQLVATGGNIWSKRMEPAYLLPFVLPHFTQIDVGDHDNLSLSVNASVRFSQLGKIWGSFFVDEISFTNTENLFKMPRNRYAWQMGWNTTLLSTIIPGTLGEIRITRVTPFVYTHYPETDFNTFGSRPLDMTYSHDEFNLGFYLPPNSRELKISLKNMAIPDLYIEFHNRFIVHGTNDLAGERYQIFGDIYRHQSGNIYEYPLLDFGNDGFYDKTWISSIRIEKKVRKFNYLGYFKLIAELGYSQTKWEINDSGIAKPPTHHLFTGNVGIAVEI